MHQIYLLKMQSQSLYLLLQTFQSPLKLLILTSQGSSLSGKLVNLAHQLPLLRFHPFALIHQIADLFGHPRVFSDRRLQLY